MEYSIHPTPTQYKTSRNSNEYKEMLFNLGNTFKVTYGRLLFYAQ